jgi:2-amino-4-hydroxy-6-hydroxymethyldihydropteridine diphosphokinase / dihydropteroate synthase
MRTFLGLGSNLGDRRAALSAALKSLTDHGLALRRVSPVVECPALLPDGATADWNRPFLNLVAEFETDRSPHDVLALAHSIETLMGRRREARWAPRPVDIDILLWGDDILHTPQLTVPHPQITRRSFVLTPLLALDPYLTIPGMGAKTLLEWSQSLPDHLPLWMAIVNITPDSFSDGGLYTDRDRLAEHVDSAVTAGAHILDLGAESTRPGATPLTADEEWARLEPALEWLIRRYHGNLLRPQLSIDTYHPEVAQRALAAGVDMINDVSGLTDARMLELAAGASSDWVAMHHVTIPADREHILPADCDPCERVERWLHEQMAIWQRAGLDLRRVIFDPGIGFGKNPLQSLKLLRDAARFRQHGVRVLIGHSRKSFMNTFAGSDIGQRDLITLGASLRLCEARSDILRVHNVPLHTAAFSGWAHLAP